MDEIIAYLEFEDENCPGCGEPKLESFNPANEYEYRATVLQCHACATKRRAEKKIDDKAGIYSFVERR